MQIATDQEGSSDLSAELAEEAADKALEVRLWNPFTPRGCTAAEACRTDQKFEHGSLCACNDRIVHANPSVKTTTTSTQCEEANVLNDGEMHANRQNHCVIRESNPGLYRGRVLFYH